MYLTLLYRGLSIAKHTLCCHDHHRRFTVLILPLLPRLLRQGAEAAVRSDVPATTAAAVGVDPTAPASTADEQGGGGNFGGLAGVKSEEETGEEEEGESEEGGEWEEEGT